jgi:hypothetical protein
MVPRLDTPELHSTSSASTSTNRPWIVLANEHRTVDRPDGQDFGRWARERSPDDRYRILPERQTERWPPDPASEQGV